MVGQLPIDLCVVSKEMVTSCVSPAQCWVGRCWNLETAYIDGCLSYIFLVRVDVYCVISSWLPTLTSLQRLYSPFLWPIYAVYGEKSKENVGWTCSAHGRNDTDKICHKSRRYETIRTPIRRQPENIQKCSWVLYWIQVAQCRSQWWLVVNEVLNLEFHKARGNTWPAERVSVSHYWMCSMVGPICFYGSSELSLTLKSVRAVVKCLPNFPAQTACNDGPNRTCQCL